MRSKHIGNLSNYKYFVHNLGENVFVIVCTMSKTFHVCFLLMSSNRLLDLLQVALQRANQMSRGGHVPPQAPSLDKPLPKTPLSFLEEKSQSHRRLVQADRKDLICSVLLPEPGSFIPNHARSLNSILIPEK